MRTDKRGFSSMPLSRKRKREVVSMSADAIVAQTVRGLTKRCVFLGTSGALITTLS
jgi:hypothetical protein